MTSNQPPRQRDIPLTSDDLSACNAALVAISRSSGIEKDAVAVSRLAAIIIELWRQGVHDVEQLKVLAGATVESDDP
ncbi:hypothetical protein [Rhizobium sp. BE258]|uniref:hypothetical protein n=1 Tax=Rhizobium sp. BE258 TaxID=2817722 RepID=UPI0028590E31|nr:hypothetical protein [Rhizobium sp. BE258]MDR7148037.1 hypothetical protein [Rhizobium sp. BE258]